MEIILFPTSIVIKTMSINALALSKLKQKDYKFCKVYLNQISKDSEEFIDAKKLLGKL